MHVIIEMSDYHCDPHHSIYCDLEEFYATTTYRRDLLNLDKVKEVLKKQEKYTVLLDDINLIIEVYKNKDIEEKTNV